MDPASIVACTGAALGIALKVGNIVKFLFDISRKFKFADAKVTLLIGYLASLKGTLEQIEQFLRKFEKQLEWQELLDLTQTTLECTQLSLSYLEEALEPLRQSHDQGFDVVDKLKILIKTEEFETHLSGVDKFVNALNLLLNAIQCKNVADQQIVLEDDDARTILKVMSDETTSILHSEHRRSRLSKISLISDDLAGVDKTFDFDAELLKSRIYAVTYRSNLKYIANQKATSPAVGIPSPRVQNLSMINSSSTQRAGEVTKFAILGLKYSGKAALFEALALYMANQDDLIDEIYESIRDVLHQMKANNLTLKSPWNYNLLLNESDKSTRLLNQDEFHKAVRLLRSDETFKSDLLHKDIDLPYGKRLFLRQLPSFYEEAWIPSVLDRIRILGDKRRQLGHPPRLDKSIMISPAIDIVNIRDGLASLDKFIHGSENFGLFIYLINTKSMAAVWNRIGVYTDPIDEAYADLKALISMDPILASKFILVFTRCDELDEEIERLSYKPWYEAELIGNQLTESLRTRFGGLLRYGDSIDSFANIIDPAGGGWAEIAKRILEIAWRTSELKKRGNR